LNNHWKRLSPRERRLALVTGLAVLAIVLYVGITRSLAGIRELDDTIETLETDLWQLTQQAARLDEVEALHSEVAEAHSSEWTQAQIHDGLREEILRLSLVNVPAAGDTTALSGPRLVDIPQFPAGTLNDRGDGYREYHLRLRTRPTTIPNVSRFLQRLHQSNQVLHIDQLEINRPDPNATEVTADIVVTRTIIGDESDMPTEGGETPAAPSEPADEAVPSEANLARNPGFEEPVADGKVPEWEVVNADAAAQVRFVSEGVAALRVQGRDKSSSVFQAHELEPAATYVLQVDLMAEAPARLEVIDATADQPLPGGVRVAGDGTMSRYVIEFRVPEGDGPVAMRVPAVEFDEEQGVVFLDNASLWKKAE
jgi:Tfp pilus assembly protein PilN